MKPGPAVCSATVFQEQCASASVCLEKYKCALAYLEFFMSHHYVKHYLLRGPAVQGWYVAGLLTGLHCACRAGEQAESLQRGVRHGRAPCIPAIAAEVHLCLRGRAGCTFPGITHSLTAPSLPWYLLCTCSGDCPGKQPFYRRTEQQRKLFACTSNPVFHITLSK